VDNRANATPAAARKIRRAGGGAPSHMHENTESCVGGARAGPEWSHVCAAAWPVLLVSLKNKASSLPKASFLLLFYDRHLVETRLFQSLLDAMIRFGVLLVALKYAAGLSDETLANDGCDEEGSISLRQLRGMPVLVDTSLHNATLSVNQSSESLSENQTVTSNAKVDECGAWCGNATDPNKCLRSGCKGCSFCGNMPESSAAAPNVSYDIAGHGIHCGRRDFVSKMSPEECRNWCSSNPKCKAYVTYENSDCASCIGLIHHDCSSEFQASTACTGTITAYNKVQELPGSVDAVDGVDTEVGTCCFSGQKSSDVCGTCFEDAFAEAGTACATKGRCGGCGGTWCPSLCVLSASNPNDKCGTALSESIANSSSSCSKGETSCSSCNGAWCKAGLTSPKSKETSSQNEEVPSGSTGFKCVMGSDEASDPCGSATKTGIANDGSYCATSKQNCDSCQGAWCSQESIKVKAQQRDYDYDDDPDEDEDEDDDDKDDD